MVNHVHRFLAVLLLTGTTAAAQQPGTLWKLSLIPVAATTAGDIWSSRGLRELNPVVGRGDFGAIQIRNKLIGVGALVAVEALILHKWPRAARPLAYVNFGYSVTTGVVVVHNLRQR